MKTAKYAFAASMLKMLEKKTLDHITVTDIVKDCGATRQAFYYHFEDVYALLRWIYRTEITSMMEKYQEISTWQEGYLQILQWIERNDRLAINTLKSINRDVLESFLQDSLNPSIRQVVAQQAADLRVKEEDKAFIARFYTLSLVALSLDWLQRGMQESPETLVHQTERLMHGNIRSALEKCAY